MKKRPTPPSTSRPTDSDAPEPVSQAWPALPTETEIYILPDGRVIVADLPGELASLVQELGPAEPCAVDEQQGSVPS